MRRDNLSSPAPIIRLTSVFPLFLRCNLLLGTDGRRRSSRDTKTKVYALARRIEAAAGRGLQERRAAGPRSAPQAPPFHGVLARHHTTAWIRMAGKDQSVIPLHHIPALIERTVMACRSGKCSDIRQVILR